MDSLESIQRDYLRGIELQAQGAALQTSAFNRLAFWVKPVIPVAMQVRGELV